MRELRNDEEWCAEAGQEREGRTAVLVVDEQDANLKVPPAGVRDAQKKVLQLADTWGWPIVFVQFWEDPPNEFRLAAAQANPEAYSSLSFPGDYMGDQQYPLNCHAAAALINVVTQYQFFTKLTASAFGYHVLHGRMAQADWRSLDDSLRAKRVRRLIVLGQEANYCVASTVVNRIVRASNGTMGRRDGDVSQGATNLGYTVLTHSLLVWGENAGREANWKDDVDGVAFYDVL